MDSSLPRNSIAYLTWAVVSICASYLHYQATGLHGLFAPALLLELLLGIGMALAIQPRWFVGAMPVRYLGLALQATAAISLNFTMHQSFLAIYTIVLAAQLPHFINLRWALFYTSCILGAYFGIWHFYWSAPSALIETLLWSTFHLFALLLNYSLLRERQQKEQAMALNQELKGTQSLLQEAAKHDERLRIARDLHDRLGHQLTALSIQLDVLRRSCPAQLQEQVEASYELAQELLKSIRSTVSDMRDSQDIDIASALKTLVDGLPGIEVELDWPADIRVGSLQLAESVFFCLQEACTNTLRHARATRLLISARVENGQLEASVQDDGNYSPESLPGNGFRGIAERMAQVNGRFSWEATNPGLVIKLSAPLGDRS